MLRISRKIISTVLFIVLTIALCVPAAAVQGFSVEPVLPENQRQTGHTFFDLIVQPGQEQELVIRITNTTDSDATMLVDVVTASTSIRGEINYTGRTEFVDDSLKLSLENLIEWPTQPVTVRAGESVDVPLKLKIPNERFAGILLGAVNVVREITQEERDSAGAIVNQFGYVTAIRLAMNENAENISANFALGDITAQLTNHRASIVAQIRNTQPVIARGVDASIEVIPVGSDTPIFKDEIHNFEMAPNSVFPYTFIDNEGLGISAGDYTARITVTHDGQTWNWEQVFTITPEAAAAVNEGAINQNEEPKAVTSNWWEILPSWAMVAIVAAIVFMILIIMMISNSRKNKKALEDLKRHMMYTNMQQPIPQPIPQPVQVYSGQDTNSRSSKITIKRHAS